MAYANPTQAEISALLAKGIRVGSPWNGQLWDENGNLISQATFDNIISPASKPVGPAAGATFDPISGQWSMPDGSAAPTTNAQGQVWVNNVTPGSNGGQFTGTGSWQTPTPGGGGFLDSVLGGVANAISSVASPIADLGPAAPLAIIGGGLAANAGLLGGASGTGAVVGDTTAAGLLDSSPIIDSAGNLVGGEVATGAVTSSPVYMGSTGGLLPIAAAGATSAPSAAIATPVTAPATNSVLADSAANSAGYGASSAGAGLNAGVGGAMTLDEITKFITDNKSVLGAAAGALASGPSSTTTTADKSPWAPAQEWMKANIARGQELQKQYQANPFSAFQQQAYNNQAGLGNSFRGAVNSLIPQMNSFQPYRRTPQSQVVSPFQFANPNLGFTSKPFGA